MNERLYKTLSQTGVGTLTVGIVVLATGLTAGILMIIYGIRLMRRKDDVLI